MMDDSIYNFTADKARQLSEEDVRFQNALKDVLERVRDHAAISGADREITRFWEQGENYSGFRNMMYERLEAMGYKTGGDAIALRVEW